MITKLIKNKFKECVRKCVEDDIISLKFDAKALEFEVSLNKTEIEKLRAATFIINKHLERPVVAEAKTRRVRIINGKATVKKDPSIEKQKAEQQLQSVKMQYLTSHKNNINMLSSNGVSKQKIADKFDVGLSTIDKWMRLQEEIK